MIFQTSIGWFLGSSHQWWFGWWLIFRGLPFLSQWLSMIRHLPVYQAVLPPEPMVSLQRPGMKSRTVTGLQRPERMPFGCRFWISFPHSKIPPQTKCTWQSVTVPVYSRRVKHLMSCWSRPWEYLRIFRTKKSRDAGQGTLPTEMMQYII